MSRRAAITEEFDDDTDLPLPPRALPNTGSRGALLQALDDDDDERPQPAPTAGPATPSQTQFAPGPGSQAPPREPPTVSDLTPYKMWTCIYPIYIDAKRAYGTGERRVARAKGVWWPLSKDIADATSRLGLSTLHEVQKCHPRDWENPGRVRVQWKRDGRLMNPGIKTKKQLLEMIAFHIQSVKPELIPKPPFTSAASDPASAAERAGAPAARPPPNTKGKQPAKNKATAISKPHGAAHRQLPEPPAPHPPLPSRVSAYSPALPTGVLLDTVKAGMNASDNVPGAPQAGGTGSKGKRKVVRVRG